MQVPDAPSRNLSAPTPLLSTVRLPTLTKPVARRRAARGPKRGPKPSPRPSVERAQARARRAGDSQDVALYSCGCGYAFEAAVTTSVGCPHCGADQAW